MSDSSSSSGGQRSPFSNQLIALYGRLGSEALRMRLRNRICKWEGGAAESLTIREIFRKFHRVEVGLYTASPCLMKPMVFHAGTSFGRYTSISDTLRTFTRNHPMNIRSTHGFFYNAELGKVKSSPIVFNKLAIGNGVWIGHNCVILNPATTIGDGAVIASGSVVYSNVPPYAIVSGYPARVVGYRFDKETIARLLALKWWEKRPDELAALPEGIGLQAKAA
jgi:virginiamycin A acetyltransferase